MTQLRVSLCNAGLNVRNRPFDNSKKAEQILAGVIEMAAAMNRDPQYRAWVEEIRIYGSLRTGAGDVDLCIKVTRRSVWKWTTSWSILGLAWKRS